MNWLSFNPLLIGDMMLLISAMLLMLVLSKQLDQSRLKT